MAYQGPDPYSRHSYPHQYAVNPPYAPQYASYQVLNPTVNGFAPQTENVYLSNGHIDPRYTVNGNGYGNGNGNSNYPQHYSDHTYKEPQRALAVAIPPHSSMPFASTGNGVPSKPSVPQPPPSPPPLDYSILLLSLAEEYFAAAYGRGSITDILQREKEMQEYYKLIATGLGCLEAVLKHYKLSPEREATVRLRYATVLYEETENTMEAEEALSKGVALCDRHKLFDLKYNMQHLLARMLFQTNSRAAFKFLDGITKDAEAYQHIAWVYAFRFLKVSLHLELSSHQDITAALTHLRTITSMSNSFGDSVMLAAAMTMEALTCLRDPGNSENFEQAQRALAGVRSLQLNPAISNIPQLAVLTAFVDLCCHLQHFDPAQAISKTQLMQNALATVPEGQLAWTEDGSFSIPIPKSRMSSCRSWSGIVRLQEDGSLVLMFNWMPKEDIYNIGYLLSGVALSHKNNSDGQKSEHMLTEGVRRQDYAQKESSKLPKSIMLATMQQSWREEMACYMRIHLAFALCARTSWPAAQEQLSQLKKTTRSWAEVPDSLFLLSHYLSGTISQGTGDLATALSIYQKHPLPKPSSHQSHLRLEIALLCALNSLLIIRTPNHAQHDSCSSILSALTTLCQQSPNRALVAGFHLLAATLPHASTILLTKQSLQSALQSAKATSNNQLMCLVLNIMSWKFFTGVVGEQAEKSARASQTLARKVGDALWMSVSAGVLAETLESAGRSHESEMARREGENMAKELTERVRGAANEHREEHSVVMKEFERGNGRLAG